MDALKKFFPLSFKYTKDVSNLVIGILIQFVAIIIVGALIGLATFHGNYSILKRWTFSYG